MFSLSMRGGAGGGAVVTKYSLYSINNYETWPVRGAVKRSKGGSEYGALDCGGGRLAAA